MADRYQDRHFPAPDDHDRGAYPNAPEKESDPLAELARLIGQTDPFGNANKTPHPLQSRANVRPPQPYEAEEEPAQAPSPPPWMQRARQEAAPPVLPPQHYEPQQYEEPEPDYEQPSAVHPLHRYAAQQPPPAPVPQQDYHEEPQYQDAEQAHDPARYDDALYGQLEASEHDLQRDPAYPDDPYAYQSDYAEDEPAPRKRSNGLTTVAAVLALAVVGTGAAFAYKTYVGSPRSGEPPIIKADNTPTKVVPAPADAPSKTPDRMATGDGTEKLVSREETPVDVNAKAGGPRVVFPPLNQNGNPPSVASVTTAPPPATAASNGTMPNGEPRKIKTLSVKGDANDAGTPAGAQPPAKQAGAPKPAAPAAPRGNPASANASANGPLSLAPTAEQAPAAAPPTRMASTTPAPTSSGGGGYLVQVSSQKNEADAQASYRSLQGKYASVLGAQPSVVKRVDLGEKGVYYRAFAGPFSSAEQASQVCNNLKAAGGPQCLIQRN